MIRMFLATLVAMLAATASIGLAQTTSAKVAHGSAPAVTFPEGVPSPVIADKFTADPHAVVIGDTYYIYPTVDKENWLTTEFNVWSSNDLIHWKDEGVILDLAGEATGRSDVSWAKIRAWAPGVVAQMATSTITSVATRISVSRWRINPPAHSKTRWAYRLLPKGRTKGR